MFSDFNRYKKPSTGIVGLIVPILNPMFWAIFIYRLANFFYKIKLYPLSKLFQLVNFFLFKVEINFRSTIKKGFKINHGIGTVIGGGATIGENVTVFQGVTIGGNMGKMKIVNKKKVTQPIIEDGAIIGPYAQILGPVTIGENSHVAAHTIVTKDIPSNTIVFGNPNQYKQRLERKRKI